MSGPCARYRSGVGAVNGADWRTWRRQTRRELIAARRALSTDERAARNGVIDGLLERGFKPLGGSSIGFCWPFAAEPEPRFAVRRWRAAGSRAALPCVVAPRMPLEFREWWPGVVMTAGVYGIPSPQDTPLLAPEAMLMPVNGFDRHGYRLGYGGGYFDRTLAAMPHEPLKIGLGYELARLDTIMPQSHDIPLDAIVTEAGIEWRIDGVLQSVDEDQAAIELNARLAAGWT